MFTLKKKERDESFRNLRENYLDSLCEPIELYSEIMCRNAASHIVRSGEDDVGYVLIGDGGVLLEFFILNEYLPHAPKSFKLVFEELQVKKAVCQSWDHLFMSMCLIHFKERKIVGFNFRDKMEPKQPVPQFDLNVREATLEDVALLTEFRDGIFEDDEIKDIPYWIEKGGCRIFEDGKGNFVGYGMFNRTIEGRNWFDIGMYIRPELRKKGYGTFIIDRMADHCISNGWRPTAGCEFENIGSKKTLERAGFVSKHVTMEFKF